MDHLWDCGSIGRANKTLHSLLALPMLSECDKYRIGGGGGRCGALLRVPYLELFEYIYIKALSGVLLPNKTKNLKKKYKELSIICTNCIVKIIKLEPTLLALITINSPFIICPTNGRELTK